MNRGDRITIAGRRGVYEVIDVDPNNKTARVKWADHEPEPQGGNPNEWVPFAEIEEGGQ